jgi:imidazolonepropionase-like amidohydrolase
MGYRIEGTVLPTGRRQELFIADGMYSSGPVDGATTLLEDAWLLPGLVDVHAHLQLASPAPEDAPPLDKVLSSGRAHLDAGVCLVREPGGPDHLSAGMGPADGMPRTLTAGRFLAPAGRYFPGLAREVGEEALPDAAVEELRAGGGTWAKVIGDFPVPGQDFLRTYSGPALAEAAARVHAAGGRIAVHCTLPEVVQDAIDAGVDSLEHATLLQADQVAGAARAGVAWVPTRTIEPAVRGLLRAMELPEPVVRRVEEGLARQPEVLREAVATGVRVFAGTDAGMGPHGQVAGEVRLLCDAGLDTGVALAAGSWAAREWLGLPGITAGAPADLVAYREDPRETPGALDRPVLVVLDGAVVRDAR